MIVSEMMLPHLNTDLADQDRLQVGGVSRHINTSVEAGKADTFC